MVWFGDLPRAVGRCAVLAGCLLSHGVRAETLVSTPTSAEQREQCLKAHESGQLLRLDGKLVEAKRSLTACAAEACPNAVRADCTAWLAQLAESTPSIVLAATSERGDETRVRVLLDGAELTSNLDGKAIELDPGPHTFRFELSPYPAVERELVLREGERERMLAIRFEHAPAKPLPQSSPVAAATAPAPPSAAAGPRPVPWISYALGGLSLAAIGSATTFGLIALHERREKLDGCAPLCSGHDKADVELPALAADISVAVALIAGGAAAYTYWTRPEVAPPPRISISSGTRFALLRYRGEF
ncbi:MAG TPA: hypothetical protein VG937_28015 [Polyangiaceae bacterium]|nr:hypothetical protein [Polyangiaceae bacterium]